MSDRTSMLFVWGFGVIVSFLAIPFLPRQEVRTPLRAVGAAIMFGAALPLLLTIYIIHFAPWLYWSKWVEYREFLVATKTTCLEEEFRDRWHLKAREEFPEIYQRQKRLLESDLSQFDAKANKLFSRKKYLERKLRN